MSMDPDQWSERVIGACIAVHRALGAGFKEVTYGNALAVEFKLEGIPFQREVLTELTYRAHSIGLGKIDFVIGGELVLELKALDGVHEAHRNQVVTYLRATGLTTGLLVNFHAQRIADDLIRVKRDRA